ncbi:MAG: hypothetical protein ABSB95_05320 [Dissulfurispiraceae bacterium]|jgi:hypothetical protein
MKKYVPNSLFFTAAVIALIVLLRFLNWLPLSLEQGIARKYSSIEEVKAKLNIKKIYAPSYFPENFAWPPYEIIAQTKPFTSVTMKFRRTDRMSSTLVICQSDTAAPLTDSFPRMAQLKESITYPLKGRQALLDVGICRDKEPCSSMTWLEGRYRIAVAVESPPFELIKISESMLH